MLKPLIRITKPTVRTIEMFMASEEPLWGLAISKSLDLPTGSIYPMLDRLVEAGWLTFVWELDNAAKGPRKKLYLLTDDGRAAAEELLRSAVAPQARTLQRGATNEI